MIGSRHLFIALMLSLFVNSNTLAQMPSAVFQAGGDGIENLKYLQQVNENKLLIGGVFDESFFLGGEELTHVGEDDVFLSKLDGDNHADWILTIGSDFDDELSGVAYEEDEYVYITGSFWLETQIDTFHLTSTESPKSIFLVQLASSTGTVNWAQTIEGSDIKIVNDIQVNSVGDIVLTGYFSEAIYIGDTTLNAQAETDFFLATFDNEGSLKWALNNGHSGVTKSEAVAVLSNDEIAIAGVFNDSLYISDTLLVAETFDNDIFISAFSPEGEELWVEKAGGVHEESIVDIDVDNVDNIYLSGHFIGVINLEDDLSIQSSTGWADLFVLKYDGFGQILNARRYGGDELQHNTGLLVTEDHLWMTGNFIGTMLIGENTYDAGTQTAGFMTRLDHDLNPETGWSLRSAVNNVFPTVLSTGTEGEIMIGGGYGNDIIGIDDLTSPAGPFDIFVIKYPEDSVNANFDPSASIEVTLFPNPSSEVIYIQTEISDFQVQLLDANGQRILYGQNKSKIDVSFLPAGVYFVEIFNNSARWQGSIIVD